MNTCTSRSLALVATLLASASLAAAPATTATLVDYNFNADQAPSNILSGLTAGDVTWGPFDGVAQSNNTYWRSTGQGAGNSANLAVRVLSNDTAAKRLLWTDTSSPANVFNFGSYVEFTVTPDAAQSINLESFSAWVGGTSGGSTVDGFSVNAFLTTSLTGDNYATVIGQSGWISVDKNTTNSGQLSVSFSDASLSAWNFTGIENSVTFRIYLAASTAGVTASKFQYARLDDIVLTGTVSAIPEPATTAVFGASLLLLGTVALRIHQHRSRN